MTETWNTNTPGTEHLTCSFCEVDFDEDLNKWHVTLRATNLYYNTWNDNDLCTTCAYAVPYGWQYRIYRWRKSRSRVAEIFGIIGAVLANRKLACKKRTNNR